MYVEVSDPDMIVLTIQTLALRVIDILNFLVPQCLPDYL